MKKITYLGIFHLLITFSTANAQDYHVTEAGIKTAIKGINIEVQFYTPSIVRVIKYPAGAKFEKQSLAVIKSPERILFTTKKSGDELLLKSKAINIKINLETGGINYLSASSV